jgi:capsular exopolysaccharide synthesis family protein
MQDPINTDFLSSESNGIDFRIILARILKYWYWLALGGIIGLIIAYVYVVYASPVYLVTSKMLVEDDKGSSLSSLASGGAGLDFSDLVDIKNNADNEVQILQSRSLMTKVVDKMKLNEIIYSVQNFKEKELYDEAPFVVDIIYTQDTIVARNYDIEVLKDQKLKVKNAKEDVNEIIEFNKPTKFKQYYIKFKRNNNPLVIGRNYRLLIVSKDSRVEGLLPVFKAELPDKKVTTIDLSLNYPNPKKGEVILDSLMDLYMSANQQNKARVANSALTFIDGRLSLVSEELNGVEKQLETYKSQNNIADVEEQSKTLVANASEYYDKLNTIDVQLNVIEDLEKYIKDTTNQRIIPSTLTVQDPAFASAIEAYDLLIADKDKQSLSYTDSHPVIKSLDQQIRTAHSNLIRSYNSYKRGLIVSRQKLVAENSRFNAQIKNVPQKERIFLDYTRHQNVKQQLYLFLLQKKEETAISKTSTLSSTRIIDNAKSSYLPVKPKKKLTYLLGLFIGVIVPFAIFTIRDKFNIKLLSKSDVKAQTDATILGEISHNESEQNLVVNKNSRSVISEQFRGLRTNLQFLLNPANKSNVIMITSSMSGEGKSFISLNIGCAISLSDKKVVFVELDLRKPKLSLYVGLNSSDGFTNYAISEIDDIDHLIKPLWFSENCCIVSSGPIPPNPSELLLSEKLDKLIKNLKSKFDYIVIDSAPVGLVSDALLMEKYADT